MLKSAHVRASEMDGDGIPNYLCPACGSNSDVRIEKTMARVSGGCTRGRQRASHWGGGSRSQKAECRKANQSQQERESAETRIDDAKAMEVGKSHIKERIVNNNG